MAEKRVKYIVEAHAAFDPTFDKFDARLNQSEDHFRGIEEAAGVSMESVRQLQDSASTGFGKVTDGARRCAEAMGNVGAAGMEGLHTATSAAEKLSHAVGKVAHDLDEVYTETKAESPAVATALGIAFGIFIGGTLLGGIYAVYKALTVTFGFMKGLVTGEAYDNEYVKHFLALNSTMKETQKEYGVTAARASAYEQAAAVTGRSVSSLANSQEDLQEALNKAGAKFAESKKSLVDQAVYALAAAQAVKQYAPEIEKTEKIVADSYQRMADYGLLWTSHHTKAAAEFEASSRVFQREQELTSRGFKQAIADTVMPILGDFQSFFAEGFPTAVRIFRGVVATLTALFYGLKTSIYMVAEAGLALSEIVGTSFVAVSKAAALAVAGNFSESVKALEEGRTAVSARWSEMQDNIAAQAEQSRTRIELAYGFNISDADNLFQPIADGAGRSALKVKTKFDDASDSVKEDLSGILEALGKLDNKINGKTFGFDESFQKDFAILSTAFALGIDSAEQYAEKYQRLIQLQPFYKKGLEEEARWLAHINKLRKEAQSEEVDEINAHNERIDVLQDANKSLQQEMLLLGKTALEREIYLAGLDKESALKTAITEKDRQYVEQMHATRVALLTQYAGQKERLETNVGLIKSMDEAGRNFLTNFEGNATPAFKRIGQALKASILDLLWQLTARRWLIQVGANLSGTSAQGFAQAAGMPGAAGGGGNGLMGNLLSSAAGSLFSSAGAYAAAVPGLTSAAAGSQAAMLAAQTGAFGAEGLAMTAAAGGSATGGIAASVANAIAAIPVWGWMIAAIAAIAYSMQKPGGEKEGGSYMGRYDASGNFIGSTAVPGSDNGRFYTPRGQDSMMQSIGETTARTFYETLRSLGGTTDGVTFGIGADQDPRGTAGSRISAQVRDAQGRQLYGVQDLDIGRDSAALGPALQLQSRRMILAAIQASQLPEEIAGLINSLNAATATEEEIDKAVTLAARYRNAYRAIDDTLAALGGDSLDLFKRQLTTLRESVDNARAGLEGAMAGGDAEAVANAQDQLMSALLTRYNTEMELLAEITESIRNIQAEAYSFRMQMAQRINAAGGSRDIAGMAWQRSQDLYGSLGGITDPMARVGVVNEALGALDTWFQAEQERIQRNAAAQAAAAQAIASAQASARQAEISGLQQQLSLVQQFKSLLGQTQQQIQAMRLGGANPLDAVGRLGLASGDVNALMAQFRGSSGQAQLDVANKLLPLLQTQLGLVGDSHQRPSAEYEALYNEILGNLTEISGVAQTESQRELALISQIATLQASSNAYSAQTADASQFAAAELAALNAEYLRQAEAMEAAGNEAYALAEQAYRDQLDALTGGVEVGLFSAGRLADISADIRGMRGDLREFVQTLATVTTGGTGGNGGGNGSEGGNGNITLVNNTILDSKVIDQRIETVSLKTVKSNATSLKREFSEA